MQANSSRLQSMWLLPFAAAMNRHLSVKCTLQSLGVTTRPHALRFVKIGFSDRAISAKARH
jgi:hypothetical protein